MRHGNLSNQHALIGAMCVGLLFGITGCVDENTESASPEDVVSSDKDAQVSAPDTKKSAPTGGSVGAACKGKSDCTTGVCFSGSAFTGGYCSKHCGGHLFEGDDQCPSDSTCVQVGEAATVCLADCLGGDSDCREGYLCQSIYGASVCYPGCSTDSDCEQGTSCDPETGICQSGGVSPGAPGAACESDAACEGEIAGCMTEAEDAAFDGGYCLSLCDGIDDGDYCPGKTGICAHIDDDDGEVIPICLGICSTSVDCREGYWCSTKLDAVGVDGFGACLPNCGENNTCDEEGTVCDPVSGICVEADSGSSGAPAEITVIPLGDHAFSDADDVVITTVEVPEGANSFALVAQKSGVETIYPVQVESPSGQVIYDGNNPMVSDYTIIQNVVPGYFSAMFPNSPRLQIMPGKYTFTFATEAAMDLSIKAVFKTSKGDLTSGSLPVVFWFTNNEVLSAEGAQTHQVFQDAVEIFKDIYAEAGITLGPITYKTLPEPQATDLAVVNENDTGAFFPVAADADDKGVNFFFCEQLTSNDGGVLLGISGGIPGPPSINTLPHGGVILSLAHMGEDSSTFGETLAHEAGHYLGLFHLSESEGTSHDPLLDTPECSAKEFGVGETGETSTSICETAGADNFMFWTAGDVKQRKITADQSWVLLRHPSVQ